MAYLLTGVVPDMTVRAALVRLLPLYEETWITIVRGVDSARKEVELMRALDIHRVPHQVVDGNVRLSPDDVRPAIRAGVFTGFDEVWIVKTNPPNLSALRAVTSDTAEFSAGVPDVILEVFKQTAGVVVLGDGCGLNYLAADETIARRIRARTGR